MERRDYDLAIIGGGIVGCAIARDAAGRGLSVFLCEQGDIGGGASSATAKLAHGGLAHLAAGRLSALRRSLRERDALRRAAPHLVAPVPFLLPWHERMWPQWTLSAAFRLRDLVGGRGPLAGFRRVDLEAEPAGRALQGHFTTAFAYSDCVADDARLTVINAVDARAHGAEIAPRTRCLVAEREGTKWRLSLEPSSGLPFTVGAGRLVNASGAAAAETVDHVVHTSHTIAVRCHKTVAVYVRRMTGDEAYALPNADGRIVYVAPHLDDFTLIAVEGLPHRGAHDRPEVSARDVAYLCDAVGQYFRERPTADDVVRAEAGLTALPETADPTTAEAAIDVDAPPHQAALYTVMGGALTTHRRTAERAVDLLAKSLRCGPAWTETAPLPGGSVPDDGHPALTAALTAAYPFMGSLHAARLVAAYGARASEIMVGASGAADFGAWFGGYLTERELAFLRQEEWAHSADDVLWRRSRLGLSIGEEATGRISDWFDAAKADETAEPVESVA